MTILIEDFEKNGINYIEALRRFDGNEDLYRRLAVKFLDDPNFIELEKTLHSGDAQKAQRAAHSLKGVAGNLSFDDLYQISCKLNGILLQGDIQTAQTLMPQARQAYESVCGILRRIKS